MSEQEIVKSLCVCIEQHCPNLVKSDNAAIPSLAHHIAISYEKAYEALGIQEGIIPLEKLVRSTRTIVQELDDLSPALKSQLNFRLPKLEGEETLDAAQIFSSKMKVLEELGILDRSNDNTGKKNNPPLKIKYKVEIPKAPSSNLGIVRRRLDAARSLLVGLEELLAHQKTLKKPTRKLQYQAAAVANACRKVWREEKGGTPAPFELQKERVQQPLHKFVSDIFEVLSITKAKPASAFKRCKDIVDEHRKRCVEEGIDIKDHPDDEWVFKIIARY